MKENKKIGEYGGHRKDKRNSEGYRGFAADGKTLLRLLRE
jgi:hypothetical protein